MNTINVNNTIENYLSGAASKAEEAWLLGEMKENPELVREVDLRRRTNDLLKERSILELRNRLEIIEMNRRSSKPVRRAALKIAKYAAAVAFIALISASLYFPLHNVPADRLYQQYYKSYELQGASRSVSVDNNKLMTNALAAYQSQDYQVAISYLKQLIDSEKRSIEAVFAYGVTNMEASNYPEAGGSFREVLDHNDNLYLEDAAWYLGLCYMMNNETDKAIAQLNLIANSKSRYNKEARKLSKKLR